MGTKKILILGNSDIVIYKFRKELVKELVNKQYKVYVSATSSIWKDSLEKIGCVYFEVNIDRHNTKISKELALLFYYIHLIHNLKPDLLITYTIKPNIYVNITNYLFNIPSICNITGLGGALENDGILLKIVILFYRIAMRKVNCLFFQNEANKEFFVKNRITCPNIKLVAGSGVNLEEFIPLPYLEKEWIDFFYIGRVMRDKGINEFLDAAIYIRANYPKVRFHICGFCEDDYEQLIEYHAGRGNIIYHGLVKDIRKAISYADCIILPSYHEGMSNTLLEAAACGRPILASNIPGCKEVVINKKNGFLFPPRDVMALQRSIETFLSLSLKQRLAMGDFSRRIVETKFNRKDVVNIYINEINNLLGD